MCTLIHEKKKWNEEFFYIEKYWKFECIQCNCRTFNVFCTLSIKLQFLNSYCLTCLFDIVNKYKTRNVFYGCSITYFYTTDEIYSIINKSKKLQNEIQNEENDKYKTGKKFF